MKMLVEALKPVLLLWRDLKTKLNGLCEHNIYIMDSYLDSLDKALDSKNFEDIKVFALNIFDHLEIIEMELTNHQIK